MASHANRFHPLYDMLSLQDSLVRAFDAAVGRNGPQPEIAPKQAAPIADWAPAVDAFEDAEGLHLFVEVPGLSQADIDLRIEGTTLTLRGERKLDRSEPQGYRFVERAHGVFQRSFTLPETIDAENVSAEAKDGVLKIRLPKKAESRPRQIKVQVDAARLDRAPTAKQ